jgi:hypothetical protein
MAGGLRLKAGARLDGQSKLSPTDWREHDVEEKQKAGRHHRRTHNESSNSILFNANSQRI